MKIYFLIIAFIVSTFLPLSAQTPISFSNAQLVDYLTRVSSLLSGRPLSKDEYSKVMSGGHPELVNVIKSWVNSDFFVTSSKILLQTQLGISGKNNIDYELPGNLMAYVVQQNLPFSQILTADYCVNENGQKINCDTGAPFNAGILTTRAYMTQFNGRYNLSRAGNLLAHFSCSKYPLNDTLQPRLSSQRLIPLFKTDQDPGAAEFGNGTACYGCHSQFGAHAQLFIKFDISGQYQGVVSGVQGEGLETGKSTETLYASHLSDPNEASSESSQMYGRNVANLREAAQVITENQMFVECAVRNAIRFYLRIEEGNSVVNTGVVREVAKKLKANQGDPNYRQIVLESLTHPFVIGSLLYAGETL